jgi:hypothetical protein
MIVKAVSSVLLCFLVASAVMCQQQGSLYGCLDDADSHTAIEGASVEIKSLERARTLRTRTEKDGRFVHLGIPRGTYIVTISHDGYVPIDVFGLIIESEEPARLRLRMYKADRVSFKRHLVRYQQPLLNFDSATIKYVYRNGGN